MTDYVAAIRAAAPEAEFAISNNDYSTLVWHSEGEPPAKEDLDAAWPQLEHEIAHARVEAERKAAYERDADPVFFRWQRGDATEQDWKDAVDAVRAAHPYPAAPKAKKASK